MTSDAAARAREGLQQGFLAEPLPQRLAASLRACATLPAGDTRSTSLLVVPTFGGSRLSFFCSPLEAERPGSGRCLV